MTTSTARASWQHPRTSDPVFLASAHEGLHAEPMPLFGDDRWDITAMARKSSAGTLVVNFGLVPQTYRQAAKHVIWSWINRETPVDMLDRATAVRPRFAATSIYATFRGHLLPFLRWLENNDGPGTLREITEADLIRYSDWVHSRPSSRDNKAQLLFGVTRIWLHGPYLPRQHQLRRPPWEDADERQALGPANWTGENKKVPLHPQVASPLLMWALRFVDRFADDIIAASLEADRIEARSRIVMQPGDDEIVQAYLSGLVDRGEPLPGYTGKGKSAALANVYLSGMLDVGTNALLPNRIPRSLPIRHSAPLTTPVTARLEDGTPWMDHYDFYEARELRSLLATACLIVTTYLSGLRDDEARELRRGCCTELPQAAAGPPRFQITGYEFKAARDQDGSTIPGGRIRERPWHVVAPVARAISVAERLSSSDYVFDQEAFSRATQRESGKALDNRIVRERLAYFITWVNDYAAANGREREIIPDDPDGPVAMARFRRTLAWFIYRRPGGRIALGLHYGHLRFHTTDGYGARTVSGLRDVFPMEEARARAEALTAAAERLEDGEQVSGPAATRYLDGVSLAGHQFAGAFLTPKQLVALNRNPALLIYDNPHAALACCYQAKTAGCHPDKERRPDATRTPDLTRCVAHCGNVARTDHHIEQLKTEIRVLRRQARSDLTPEPLRQRHLQRIETLQATIAQHRKSRRGAQPMEESS